MAEVTYGSGLYGAGAYVDAVTQGYETSKVNKALTPLPRPWITGMKLKNDIQLGDLVLNAIDENGVIWVCTDIDGWWVHPDPAVPDIERGYGDGSYDVRGRWLARQITLSGSILTPDPSLAPAARNTLIAATSLVYSNGWLKVDEEPTRAAKVRLSGRPSITSVNARGRIDFTIGLRAADPIKYEWNAADPDGYTIVNIPSANTAVAETGSRVINNGGNIKVPAVFTVTGPLTGTGTIYNAANDEFITIIQQLRAATTHSVTNAQHTSNVATLTTSAVHNLIIDDVVTVAGVNATYNGVHVITGTPTTSSFTYEKIAANVASAGVSGTASIDVDVLEIDTHDHSVTFNGITAGTRSMLEVLLDWIRLEPGDNEITFTDDGDATGVATLDVYYRSGWIG